MTPVQIPMGPLVWLGAAAGGICLARAVGGAAGLWAGLACACWGAAALLQHGGIRPPAEGAGFRSTASRALFVAAMAVAMAARSVGVMGPPAELSTFLGIPGEHLRQVYWQDSGGILAGDRITRTIPVFVQGTVENVEWNADGTCRLLVTVSAPALAGQRVLLHVVEDRGQKVPRRSSGGEPFYPGCRVEGTWRIGIPKAAGNWGEFSYRQYLAEQGIFLAGYAPVGEVRLLPGGSGPGWFWSWRQEMIHTATAAGSRDSGGLLAAALLGDTRCLSPDSRQRWQQTGVYHLLVVSGVHVGLVAAALMALLRRLGFGLPWTWAAGATAGWAYTMLAGAQIPSVRSALMLTVVAVLRAAGMPVSAWNTLALAGLVLLCWQPMALFSLSFRLSVLATAATLLAAQVSRSAGAAGRSWGAGGPTPAGAAGFLETSPWKRALHAARTAVAFAALVEIVLWPLQWEAFGGIPGWGIVNNLILGPVVTLALITGLCGLLPAWITGQEELFLGVARQILEWSDVYLRWAARWPGAWAFLAQPPAGVTGLLLAALVVLGFSRSYFGKIPAPLAAHKWRRGRQAAVFLLVFLCGMAAGRVCRAWLGPGLEVTFLDVGQGLSVHVRVRPGIQILFDAGGSNDPAGFDVGGRVVLPYLRRDGVRSLQLLAASHRHADHFAGCAAVVSALPVQAAGAPWAVLAPGEEVAAARPKETPGRDPVAFAGQQGPGLRSQELRLWRQYLEQLERAGIPLRSFSPGMQLRAGEGLLIRCLAPLPEAAAQADENTASLVWWLQYGRFSLLLPADLESPGLERTLAVAGKSWPLDLPYPLTVLQVPHHGSAKSLSPELLSGLQPLYAVISVGPNGFRHPAKTTLRLLEHMGIPYFRTDVQGAVRLRTDGSRLWIHTKNRALPRGPDVSASPAGRPVGRLL